MSGLRWTEEKFAEHQAKVRGQAVSAPAGSTTAGGASPLLNFTGRDPSGERSSVGSERRPVTPEVAGSSPAVPANGPKHRPRAERIAQIRERNQQPRRKFGNNPTWRGNILFDSEREAKRYDFLHLRELAREITDLRRQVKFVLIPRQDGPDGKCLFRAMTLTVDFTYIENGQLVAEDAKGYPDDRWPIKRKLMLFVHKIFVREV